MLNANEQLFLELVNAARLDPLGEAARQGVDLNEGLPNASEGWSAIDPVPVQALAPNAQIHQAAQDHSQWMLDNDTFSHTGVDGSDPGERMVTAGYAPADTFAWGENIAISFTTGQIDAQAAITTHHDGLFDSPGHRVNLFRANFRETGGAQVLGDYTAPDDEGVMRDWDASMLTHKFGLSGSNVFLTGVIYTDADSSGAYSVGEGVGDHAVAAGEVTTTSWAAGGYTLGLASNPAVSVTLGSGAGVISVVVDLSGDNVKLDVESGRILTSGNVVLGDGARDVQMLGAVDNSVTGNAQDNVFHVGRGDNTLIGGGGADTAVFTGAAADYEITPQPNGQVQVRDSRTGPDSDGTNLLTDFAVLQFSDGTQNPPAATDVALTGSLSGLDGAPVAAAGLRFTLGDGTVHDTVSDAGGAFSFTVPSGSAGHLDLAPGSSGGGTITVTDALEVLRLAVGLQPSFGPATPHDLIAADVDRSGTVTVTDALEVLRDAVGLQADGVGDQVLLGPDQALDQLTTGNVAYDTGATMDPMTADATVTLDVIVLGDLGVTAAV